MASDERDWIEGLLEQRDAMNAEATADPRDAEIARLRALVEQRTTERDVWSGEACREEQAAGNGPCGACRYCYPAQLAAAHADNAALRAALEQAEALNRINVCAYCQAQFQRTPEDVRRQAQHILCCEKNPLTVALHRVAGERDEARAQLAAAQAKIARLTERRFPIIGGPSIPWAMIAPYERQALRNHNQTLERLAERGGLSPMEAMAVFDGHRLRPPYEAEAAALGRLRQLLREYEQQHATPAPGAPLLDAVRRLVEAAAHAAVSHERAEARLRAVWGTDQVGAAYAEAMGEFDGSMAVVAPALAAVRALMGG